jgi:hypothetical protein
VVRCLAVRNRSSGFYANHHPGGIDWLHNSAYRNSVNFNFLGRNAAGDADIPGRDHQILNNLSYGSSRDVRHLDLAASHHAGNSFDRPQRLRDADFLSLDEASLIAPRQPDGGLPAIRFLHLAKANPLIDTGVPAAQPFTGKAPDPGAFESP